MNKYFRARASMVFIMTNNEVMNQIIAFYRDLNGMLTFVGKLLLDIKNIKSGTISKGQRGLKMKLKMRLNMKKKK